MTDLRAFGPLDVRRLQKHFAGDALGELGKGDQGPPRQGSLKISGFLASEHLQGGHLLDPCAGLADLRGAGRIFHGQVEQLERLRSTDVGLQPLQGPDDVDRRSRNRRSRVGIEQCVVQCSLDPVKIVR